MVWGQRMAQILNFRTPEYRADETDGRPEGQPAEVILFPGVRYERWEDRDGAARSEQQRATRDVIELADR